MREREREREREGEEREFSAGAHINTTARAHAQRSALFVHAAWKVNSHSHPTRRSKYHPGFIRMERALSSTTQHAGQGVCVTYKGCVGRQRGYLREKQRLYV
jgi:hypothetical protein